MTDKQARIWIVILAVVLCGSVWLLVRSRRADWNKDLVTVARAGSTSDAEFFTEQIRTLAGEFAQAFPEGSNAMKKFAAAIGDEASAAKRDAEAAQHAADGVRYESEEKRLVARIDVLAGEVARLERIGSAQRQLVTDVMREGMRLQEDANQDADWKSFSLGVVSSLAAAGILALAAHLFRRKRPVETTGGTRSIRRCSGQKGSGLL